MKHGQEHFTHQLRDEYYNDHPLHLDLFLETDLFRTRIGNYISYTHLMNDFEDWMDPNCEPQPWMHATGQYTTDVKQGYIRELQKKQEARRTTDLQYKVDNYDWSHIPDYKELDEHTKTLLDESLAYDQCRIIGFNQQYFDFLEKKAYLIDTKADNIWDFIIGGYQGSMELIKDESSAWGYTGILFNTDKKYYKAERKLHELILNSSQTFVRDGLISFLDPNLGGRLTPERIKIASLIIFG
jgi:hypothetical protein